MVIEKFFDLAGAAPFRAFEMFLTDGRRFSVNHPDFVAIDGPTETVTVFDEHSNFADVIDIIAVVSVRYEVGV